MRRNYKARTKRYAAILGQVRDVEGGNWDVRQIRDTKHGFDLLFGSPDDHGSYRGGLPRLIATQSLVDFWEANRTKRDGANFDLPAGRTTLKRVRRRLGFNCVDDVAEFWMERIEDLESLKPREFAVRHGVNVLVAFDRRLKLLGRRARQMGWWRKAGTIEILLSDVTLREMGEKLGISISQVFRLREQARAEYQGCGKTRPCGEDRILDLPAAA
ncbi:MAG: hypothetical protein M3Y72_14235 [Acidobacteriota bacterium]|nr:hypothetical protein [Acidobacteriota bacterium]